MRWECDVFPFWSRDRCDASQLLAVSCGHPTLSNFIQKKLEELFTVLSVLIDKLHAPPPVGLLRSIVVVANLTANGHLHISVFNFCLLENAINAVFILHLT